MLRLLVDPEHPEPRKIAHAGAALRDGGVIAYPTDTVYALGCAVGEKRAIERLYTLKGMSQKQPLALLVPDVATIARYGVVTDSAWLLLRRLVPGPYTFVLEATREVPRALQIERNKRRTIGVRVPDHAVVQALLAELGGPIVSTSATARTGEELGQSLSDGNEVRDHYEHGIDVLVDGGWTGSEVSTVLSLIRDEVEVIRPGRGPVPEL